MATKDQKPQFIEDKVYLRGPDGVHWDHDPLLAAVPGYIAVVPNPSTPPATTDTSTTPSTSTGVKVNPKDMPTDPAPTPDPTA